MENYRFHLFDEPTVNKILREERLAANFANSFFVEIPKAGDVSQSIQYVKMNCDRKKEFRILTLIEQNDKEKFVTKKAAVPEANAHIRNVYKNDHRTIKGEIRTLKGSYCEGMLEGIKYPFLSQKTLDDRFSKIVKEDHVEEAVALVKTMFDISFPEIEYSSEYCTEEFQKVFGNEISKESRLCVRYANIDLIFEY